MLRHFSLVMKTMTYTSDKRRGFAKQENVKINLSMNKELLLILISCSSRALFLSRSFTTISGQQSKVSNSNQLIPGVRLLLPRAFDSRDQCFLAVDQPAERNQKYKKETCLFHKAKVRRIPAEFNVWSMGSSFQPSLGNFKGGAFVPQSFIEGLNVLLLVVDLLHGLAEVRLELVVSIVGLGDSLLERHVRVVPVAPHLVRCLQVQIDLQTM